MMSVHIPQTRPNLRDIFAGIAEAAPVEITGVSMDSRTARAGELFLAIAGQNTHGLEYLDDLRETGVAAIAYEPTSTWHDMALRQCDTGRIVLLPVAGLRERAGLIASRFLDDPSAGMNVVGVTGTNGKTSISHYLAQMLDKRGSCGLIGTLGAGLYGELEYFGMTTPDAVVLQRWLSALRDAGADAVAMEVSSQGLHQYRADGVHFRTAVFSNLTQDHLDYHGDMQAYGAAKARLFQMSGLQHAVINADDEFGRQLLNDDAHNWQRCTVYGLDDAIRDLGQPYLLGDRIELGVDGLQMRMRSEDEEAQLACGLVGHFNAYNLLAAAAVLTDLGLSLEEACRMLGDVAPVCGRMDCRRQDDKPLVVVDFAHTPDALVQVLDDLRAHCEGQLICVFGCGGDRDRSKRPLMGGLASEFADHVVLTDDNPRMEDPEVIIQDILAGVSRRDVVEVVRERASAIRTAIERAEQGDIVLVAGKGHEEWQEIGEHRQPFSDVDVVDAVLAEVRA